MRTLLVLAVVVLLPLRSLPAEEDPTTRGPRRDEVDAALSKGDARAAAWAAWQAGRSGWREAIPPIERRLGRQAYLAPEERTWELNQVLLDALVRMQARVSGALVLRHRDAHRDVVALLLARSGDAAAQLTLLQDAERSYFADLAAQAVGNALASHAAPGFAAHLLGALTFERTVRVYTPLPPGGRRPGDGYLSGSLREPPRGRQEALPDYPPIGIWEMQADASPRAERVGTGPIPLWVRRVAWTTRYRDVGGGHRSAQSWAVCRRAWLAQLANVPADTLGLPATALLKHDYYGPASFRALLRREHVALMKRLWEIVERLVGREAITIPEAGAIEPRIEWVILDSRTAKQVPLPPLPRMEDANPFRDEERSGEFHLRAM